MIEKETTHKFVFTMDKLSLESLKKRVGEENFKDSIIKTLFVMGYGLDPYDLKIRDDGLYIIREETG